MKFSSIKRLLPFGNTVNIKMNEDFCRFTLLFSIVYIYFITKSIVFFFGISSNQQTDFQISKSKPIGLQGLLAIIEADGNQTTILKIKIFNILAFQTHYLALSL